MIRAKLVDVPLFCVEPLLGMIREVCEIQWVEEDPDFIIHSMYGHDVLRYDGVRVCWIGENLVPDFNLCDYAMGFSRLAFGDRYRRIPLFRWYREYDGLFDDQRRVRLPPASEALAGKTRFCTMVVTNGADRDPFLAELFGLLGRYRPVDSGGKWRNSIGGAVKDKQAFLRQGKFSLVCENSSTPGYVTEKILHAFAARTVPIYWGAPDIEKDFNPAAFVNCHRFRTREEIVRHVQWLDRDAAAYAAMVGQPCFAGGREPATLSKKVILDWLSHIFGQTREAAYRRNRLYWGRRYERDLATAHFHPLMQALRLLRRKVIRH